MSMKKIEKGLKGSEKYEVSIILTYDLCTPEVICYYGFAYKQFGF